VEVKYTKRFAMVRGAPAMLLCLRKGTLQRQVEACRLRKGRRQPSIHRRKERPLIKKKERGSDFLQRKSLKKGGCRGRKRGSYQRKRERSQGRG